MDLAAEAMGSLLPKLADLLHDEKYNLLESVKSQVAFLSEELKDHHALLLRVAGVAPYMVDEQVRIWAHNVRMLSYDMEDYLDAYVVNPDAIASRPERIVSRKSSCWFKRAMKKTGGHLPIVLGKAHGDFAAAIEDMIKQLKEVTERLHRFKIDEIVAMNATATSTAVDPRLPALYRNERELVGIDEARGELVKMLTQGDGDRQKLKIVSIVGMGGVGKTTLVKAVYNRLGAEFECSAFVSLSSNNPDMKKVLRDIIVELDDAEDYKHLIAMDEKRLIDEIRWFLRNKRFLIAVDDLWSTQVWETIRFALVDTRCGSRVITTTRMHDVAAEVSGATYRLKPLSYDNSKKLFYKRIHVGEGNYRNNSQLAEVCDKILKKCSGLPLAIITAASVFASKPLEEWSISALSYGSNRYMDNMRMVLSYSYHRLPSHLRTCILHLSMIPENCWIEKDLLIWKWIAEGYIVNREPGMTSIFELGKAYFNELVNSSMIQIAEGHVDSCCVHPIVYSLIRSISSEEYFSTVLDDEHHYTSAGSSSNNIVRRIAVHRRNDVDYHHIDTNTMSIGNVRSFSASLCFVDSIMPQLISSFRVLRVLALEYCPGLGTSTTHLRQIGSLVHLRYLGLVGAGVMDEIPEEMFGGLRSLQTLDLSGTDVIVQWPSSISNLGHLMCLCVGRIQSVPEGMVGSLISLEDLRIHFVIHGDSAKKLAAELGRLERLRVLEIGFEDMDDELEKPLVESLRKLDKIQHLEVHSMWYRWAVMLDDGQVGWVPPPCIRRLVFGGIFFSEVPRWIHPDRLPHLSNLQLHLDAVEERHLKTLGILPKLRSLTLLTPAAHGNEFVVGAAHGAFTQLQFFRSNVPVKFETRNGRPPMPNLEEVEFRVSVAASEAFNYWYSSLANLPSLAKVTAVLDCRDASGEETQRAENRLRYFAGIETEANRRLQMEVTRKNETYDVEFDDQFRFRNPHFKALQREMKKMVSNRQEAASSCAQQ